MVREHILVPVDFHYFLKTICSKTSLLHLNKLIPQEDGVIIDELFMLEKMVLE